MEVIGYLNRSQQFPAPLTTVLQEGARFTCVVPTGDKYDLKDVDSIEKLEQRPTFLTAKRRKVAKAPSLAFGVSASEILVGERRLVCQRLFDMLEVPGSHVPLSDQDAIKRFLEALHWLPSVSNADGLMKAVSDSPLSMVAHLNARRLKKGDRIAYTLVVQVRRRDKTRTLYRKGIPFQKSADSVAIPQRVAGILRSALVDLMPGSLASAPWRHPRANARRTGLYA